MPMTKLDNEKICDPLFAVSHKHAPARLNARVKYPILSLLYYILVSGHTRLVGPKIIFPKL